MAPEQDKIYYRHVDSRRKFLHLNFRDVLKYKDLIRFYAKKDLVASYRQTVLGPLWLFFAPLLASLIQMFVFGYLAGFKTGGVPKIIFYLFSNTAWRYYAQNVSSNTDIYLKNVGVFGKVYFPRLTISYANMLSYSVVTGAQLVMSGAILLIFALLGEVRIAWTFPLMIIPMLQLGLLGQGMGLLYAAIVVRYRDLRQVFPLITNVLMYFSPVVYPLAQLESPNLLRLALLNPFCAPLELLRAFLWNAPYPPVWSVVYSLAVMVAVNLLGVFAFNYTERNFIDSI